MYIIISDSIMVQKFASILVVMALLVGVAYSIPIPDEIPENEEITSFFKNVGLKLQGAYDTVKKFFIELGDKIKKFFDQVTAFFKDLGEKIREVYSKMANFFDDACKKIEIAYADIVEFFQTVKVALG